MNGLSNATWPTWSTSPANGNYMLHLEVDFGAYGGDLSTSQVMSIDTGADDYTGVAPGGENPGDDAGPVLDVQD